MRLSQFALWPRGTLADPALTDEDQRAQVIAAHGLDRKQDDAELQEIVRFAATLCDVPTALVSIVERDRQWFMARLGMPRRETPRPTSFCAHAMLGANVFVIPDATLDPRFADNALVTGPEQVRFYAGAPLISSEGAPLGALCVIDTKPRPGGLTPMQAQGLEVLSRAVMQRLTCERINQSASDALDEADRRLLQLAEHLPILAWSTDADGIVEFANSALFDHVGTQDAAKLNLATMCHPDDLDEMTAIRGDARARGVRWEAKARIRTADGTYRWMMIHAWPVDDGNDGPADAWFGVGVDIDDLHRLSESHEILARELSHRIKNIFAVVSGLVSLRARNRPEVGDFARELVDVLAALGRAHDYVRPLEGRKGDSLRDLLGDLLAPYRGHGGERIAITGEDAAIGARAATPLALVFHELATNSAKYGALSSDDGTIAITLRRDGDDIVVEWAESLPGGGGGDPGDHTGFGTRLMTMSIEGQLGGKFERRFADDRLDVVLRLPQASIAN